MLMQDRESSEKTIKKPQVVKAEENQTDRNLGNHYPQMPVEVKPGNLNYPTMEEHKYDSPKLEDDQELRLAQQSFNELSLDSFQILSKLKVDTKK